MAFFTRKGLAVPEFPSDYILTEEPEEYSLSQISSNTQSTQSPKTLKTTQATTEIVTEMNPLPSNTNNLINELILERDENSCETITTTTTTTTKDQHSEDSRFDYVVDRTKGVEV